MSYPYVQSPDKIPEFFKKLAGIGVPQKFTNTTLSSLGYKSSNDRRLAGLIKFIGFIDGNGVPTQLWTRDFRKNGRGAIAQGIRQGYSDLFSHYPDANQRDDEALRTYFSANSKVGAQAIAKMVSTFKAACRLGDFSDTESAELEPAEQPATVRRKVERQFAMGAPNRDGVTININIQLQLPNDSTPETYERFFQAMKKHILSSDD